jgi:hypothetical protein
MVIVMKIQSYVLLSKRSAIIAAIAVILIPLLTSCGNSKSEDSMSAEFATLDYPVHASECGLNKLYDVQKYTSMTALKFYYKSSDFKLIDKYPDVVEYSDSMDSWSSYQSSDSAPYEQERADTLKCKDWLDATEISIPTNSKYEAAWNLYNENLSKIKDVIDIRVKLFDEMYSLLPYDSKKSTRDAFYGIVSKIRSGERIAYESHVAIRQILESSKLNDLDYWLATCPTYIEITDLFGQPVITSENGTLQIWNNTESEKTFSGIVHFNNTDGIEVASQSIGVTLPAGKSFEQNLEAVSGNDNYSGVIYPAKCTFTEN